MKKTIIFIIILLKNLFSEIFWRIIHFQLRPYVVYAHVYPASKYVIYGAFGGATLKVPLPRPRLKVVGRYFTEHGARLSFKTGLYPLCGRKCVTQMITRVSKNGRRFFGDIYK